MSQSNTLSNTASALDNNTNFKRLRGLHKKIAEHESSGGPQILYWDPEREGLCVFLWYAYSFFRIVHSHSLTYLPRPITTDFLRVTPCKLGYYVAGKFKLPSCLCAVPGINGVSPGYQECSTYLSFENRNFGEYMLGCARGNCGYEGQ